MAVGGPFVRRWFGTRGQGWAFGGGLNVLSPVWGWIGRTPQQTKQLRVAVSKVDQKRHASTEVRARPAWLRIGSEFLWEGSHNSISGARRSL
jgi:hypothetical protein